LPEPRQHRGAIPEAQVLQLLQDVPVQGPRQTLRRQQAFDAIDPAWSVPLGRQQCSVELPAIFCVDAGDVHYTPDLTFARRMSHQHREQLVNL
jgi:hypothetical protein